jgi:hypothetical protein
MRVQLRAVGAQEYQVHLLLEGEPLSRRRATIVQQQEIQAVRKDLHEQGDEAWEALGGQIRQFQEEPVSWGRHRTVDIKPVEDKSYWPDGLHAARGEAPALDRQEAEATFVLAKHPDGAGVRGGDRPLEVFLTGGLEGRNGPFTNPRHGVAHG